MNPADDTSREAELRSPMAVPVLEEALVRPRSMVFMNAIALGRRRGSTSELLNYSWRETQRVPRAL